jgi:hypothetical protein
MLLVGLLVMKEALVLDLRPAQKDLKCLEHCRLTRIVLSDQNHKIIPREGAMLDAFEVYDLEIAEFHVWSLWLRTNHH